MEITIRPGRAVLAQMPPDSSFRSGGFSNIAEALKAIDLAGGHLLTFRWELVQRAGVARSHPLRVLP